MSPTGLSPPLATRSSYVRLPARFVTQCAAILPRQPAVQPHPDIGSMTTESGWFGLLPGRSPLLGESFLFLALLRCFSSSGSLHAPMDSVRGRTPYRVRGCPIRRSSAHCVLSTPRRLSQLPTSFIGTQRLGIHRMPLLPSSCYPSSSGTTLAATGLLGPAASRLTAPCCRPHARASVSVGRCPHRPCLPLGGADRRSGTNLSLLMPHRPTPALARATRRHRENSSCCLFSWEGAPIASLSRGTQSSVPPPGSPPAASQTPASWGSLTVYTGGMRMSQWSRAGWR